MTAPSPIDDATVDTVAHAITEAEAIELVLEAADNVIESGTRLRSNPANHELFLAELCQAMGCLAEIRTEKPS